MSGVCNAGKNSYGSHVIVMPLIKIIRLPQVVVLSLTRGSTRGRWEWLSRAGAASAGGRPAAGPLRGAVTALLLLVAAASCCCWGRLRTATRFNSAVWEVTLLVFL